MSLLASEAPSELKPLSTPTGRIPLAAYIFHRLRQLGISHIFGCPGDFNLNFLDHLYAVPSMKWIGTCNELNGAYAADGYARERGLPGVLVTTYGVGELSAINGVSGAYSEHVPIIHIVGTTSRLARRDRIMIHHTLGENWDHDTFQRMSEPVRSAVAFLLYDKTFTQDVDAVLETCVKSRRPVYLYIPMDVPELLVDASPLSIPLHLEITNDDPEDLEHVIIEEILSMITNAKMPAVLVDVLAHRYGALKDVHALLEETGYPAFVTPLSKSAIDETDKSFAGLYNGELTPKLAVKRKIEESDAIVHIGPLPSDSNTGGWTQHLPTRRLIHLGHDRISVRDRTWTGIHFVPVLKRLLLRLDSTSLRKTTNGQPQTNGVHPQEISTARPSGPLEQARFWKCFSRFLQPGDCVIAEVGSAQYGTLELELPQGSTYFTQIYYSCIGFTVGALLGALCARKELKISGRVILFVGDGSLHMTVQELSTVIRHGFAPTIVLINNSGYTIERVIHGPTQRYNDIFEAWDYQNMLKFFGSPNSRSYSARTYEQLLAVLDEPEFMANKTIQLLEVFMDKFDSPWMLTRQINIVQEKFGRQLKEWDQANGRERQALDTNLYQSKFALHDSQSNEFVRAHGAEMEGAQQTGKKGHVRHYVNGAVKNMIEC